MHEKAQLTSVHAMGHESNSLSAHPPFLTPLIQLVRDLLRYADGDVGLVGAKAQQGKSACQRAY